MIKKFITVLLICIISFSSIRFEVYADSKYKRNIIKGNTAQISMKLNESAFEKANEAFLINEDNIIDGISATPLAYTKNAPIIPVKSKTIDANVEKYLDKLDVKKITIIGGSKSVSQVAANNLKRLGYEVTRIYGDDRYETSIKIANELNKVKQVKNIILINSDKGLENALGIYSFAAKENIPVIWNDGKDFKTVKSYINKNKIEKVYAIGDSKQFQQSLKENIENVEIIKEFNKLQGNLNIVKEFNNDTGKVYAINVSVENTYKPNNYISLGVVAAKQNIPILICEESLSKPQQNYLDKNNIDNLEQIGTKINDYSIYNTLMSKNFLYSMMLILILITMLIRIFIYKG